MNLIPGETLPLPLYSCLPFAHFPVYVNILSHFHDLRKTSGSDLTIS